MPSRAGAWPGVISPRARLPCIAADSVSNRSELATAERLRPTRVAIDALMDAARTCAIPTPVQAEDAATAH